MLRLLRTMMVAWLCAYHTSPACAAGKLSAFSVFQSLSSDEMATVQGKLTHVGVQPIGAYLFAAPGHRLDASVFAPFHRPGDFDYGSDLENLRTFTLSTRQMRVLIKRVAAFPEVTDGGVDESAYISFALSVVKHDTVRVFESILDNANTKSLVGVLLKATEANAPAQDRLKEFACGTVTTPGSPPSDVTGRVSIHVGEFSQGKKANQYVTTVRITNISGQAIRGPMIFVYAPSQGTEPVGHDGYVCRVYPGGAMFKTIPLKTALEPGKHVEVTLSCVNEEHERIELQYQRVYSGPGIP